MKISKRALSAACGAAVCAGWAIGQPVAPSNSLRTHQVNVDAAGMNITGDAGNEPSIAIDPTAPNRIAIGWRQFDTVASNFREAGNAYSRDGGRTWINNTAIDDGLFRSDPVLGSDADGEFFYLSLRGGANFACDLFRSANAGATWGPPVPAHGGDKMWFTIDTSAGPGRNNLYACWSTCCGPFSSMTFTRSLSNGSFFEAPMAIPSSPFWGTLSVGPDSELYIIGGNPNPRVVKSVNVHAEFETPAFTGPFSVPFGGGMVIGNPASPNPGGLCGQLWVTTNRAAGAARGHVYAAGSIDPPGGDPLDFLFSRSFNGGMTWSTPVRINDDGMTTAWQWFGTMSVSPSGRIDVAWNDTRAGPANVSRLFYSYSLDEGTTWSPDRAISAPWDSYIGWPMQNKIGDYYHMISDNLGASLAWAATLNGEQDVYFTRIGEDDCNENGVADAMDLASGASADCDGNGVPDECDIAAGLLEDSDGDGIPDSCECAPDWDMNGKVTSQDFFEFLADFFAGDADFNDSGATDSQDFFDFLAAFFAGC